MRILVVGAGAIGSYFGGRLAAAGRDVRFLARGQRAARLAEEGLRIDSPFGAMRLRPHLVSAEALNDIAPNGIADVILLAVKAYDLSSAMADFAPAMGPDSVIIPLLNGIRHLDALAARFGQRAVLGGLCMASSTIAGDGRVIHSSGQHLLVFGELPGGESPRVAAILAALEGAGFDAVASASIGDLMWRKWVPLAGLAALTCLVGGAVGEIVGMPAGREVAEAIARECEALARACGQPLDDASVGRMQANLATPGSALTASMYRDMLAGRRVEAAHILGDLLARAGAARSRAPLMIAAYARLALHEARLSAGGAQ